MLVDDLTVEVRDASLARIGQILASDLVGSEFVPRFNNVGAWKVVLSASHPLADSLRAPGAGIIVTLSNGSVLLSGPTRSATITKTATDPVGVWEILGVDDSVVLGQRLAYPTPSTADVTAQTSDYDTRTGFAETVAKNYVKYNIGSSAPIARKISALTIEADSARGLTVTGNARFDKLGELLTSLLATSGLGFTIDQQGTSLVFRVYQPTDRSSTVRMDVDNARLTKSEYSYSTPTATRVIVAGQGAGVDRTFVEVSTIESLSAETDWASRIEVFKDQRNTNDSLALTQAGAEILADGGFTIKSVSVSPSDDQTMRYGTDWGLGDKVTVVVGSDEVVKVVTEVAVIIREDGVKVGATVGDPAVAAIQDTETALAVVASDQETRISNLERNEPASSGALTAIDITTGSNRLTADGDGVVVQQGGATMFAGERYTATASSANVVLRRSKSSTVGAHAQVVSGDALGGVIFGGSTGTGFVESSAIRGVASESFTASTQAGVIELLVKPTGTTSLTPAVTVNADKTTTFADAISGTSATMSSGMTASTLRLTSTSDASTTSTTHGLQIGDTAANIRIDGNEILAVASGAVGTLYLQGDGGTVSIGNATAATLNLNSSRITGTHYAYAMSAGAVTITGNNTNSRSGTITFPSGRFSQAPIVTPGAPNSALCVSYSGVTSTGATLTMRHIDNGNIGSAYDITWQAIQMTSSTAAG